MHPHSFSDILSVTRINRLLRPLSVKCAYLVATSPCETTQTITYASKSASTPGLQVSRQQSSGSSSRIDLSNTRSAHSSSAITHVRHAYANVIQAAFAEHQPRSVCPTLASMCAQVVGNCVSELDNTEDEQEQLAQLGEFFEAVPTHHRRWMLVSYATTMVLNKCSQHPTLLYGLLEASLPYEIPLISSRILEVVLFNVLSNPASQERPLIAHSTHSTYLIDILSIWTDNSHSVYTFAQVLSSVVSTNSTVDIWSCRAMSKLLLVLRGRCLASLVVVLESLVSGITQAVDRARHDDASTLVQCLLKWTRQVFEIAFGYSPDDLSPLLNFLETVDKANVPATIFGNKLDVTNSRDDNSVFCLALFCAQAMSPHSPQLPSLVSLLGSCAPHRSAFNTLVTHLLDPIHDYNFKDSTARIAQIHKMLKNYATFLALHGLCHLEVSLWLCALYYVEHPEAESSVIVRGSTEETANWCKELVDLVDDSEKRAALSLESPFKPVVPGKKRRRAGWEEVLGCYVRKTVVSPIPILKVRPKKRLCHSLHSPRASPKHRPLRRLSNFDTLLSDAQLNHHVLHPSKRRVTFDFGDQKDWENHVSLASPCPPRKRIFMSPRKSKPQKLSRLSLPERNAPASLPVPSSDDALDLFACDTSPVKR